MVTLLFLPKGGLDSTTSNSLPLAASASFTSTGTGTEASPPMPCSTMFMQQSRATLSTSSTPRSASVCRCLICAPLGLWWRRVCA